MLIAMAQRAAREAGERHDAAPDQRDQQPGGEQRQQHRQRRGVGRGRERDAGRSAPSAPSARSVSARSTTR